MQSNSVPQEQDIVELYNYQKTRSLKTSFISSLFQVNAKGGYIFAPGEQKFQALRIIDFEACWKQDSELS